KKEPKKPEEKKESPKESDQEKLAKIRADTTIKSLEDLNKALAKARQDTLKKPVADAGNVEKPEMTIWHWQDKRLQSRQEVQERQDKNFSFLATYLPTEKKFVRLADSLVRSVNLTPK